MNNFVWKYFLNVRVNEQLEKSYRLPTRTIDCVLFFFFQHYRTPRAEAIVAQRESKTDELIVHQTVARDSETRRSAYLHLYLLRFFLFLS